MLLQGDWFAKQIPAYYPVMGVGKPYTARDGKHSVSTSSDPKIRNGGYTCANNGVRYPKSILSFNVQTGRHPTQKPVALCEYLIQTYTREGDLVLDNCAGSGTTGVACQNPSRRCILMEMESEYIRIAEERLTHGKRHSTEGQS
jgi:site-specific DNA-methyltransferase (adenine-specific)